MKRFLFWRRKADPVAPATKPTIINHEMEDNAVVLWSQRWLIDFIDAFLMRWCQFSLMIGCILGTFGLYATSFNLTAQPAFNGVWAGIQAVSIDGLFFAVWSVWRRSEGKGWLRTWYFFIGVLLMIVAAMVNGVVSYTELHKVATISLTMQELHIDESAFSWSRSVLVVLVAVLITTLPRGSKIAQPVLIEQPPVEETVPIAPPEPAVDIEKVLQTMVAMNERTLQSAQEMNRQALNVTIEHFTNITVEAVKEAMSCLPMATPLPQIEAPVSGAEVNGTVSISEDESAIRGSEFEGTYGDKIEVLLNENPDLNGRQIAETVGCSERTARKWKNRIQIITPLED